VKLFYGGAEVPGWRKLLAAERVPAVSLSFVGLSRRIKKLEIFDLAEKFPEDPGFRQEIFVDSGAYSLNKQGADYSDVEAVALAAAYFTFVARNIERIDVYSEFDALLIDPQSREEARQALHELAPAKFMPIWHAEYGVDELERLADSYERVGILQPARETVSDLSPVLRKLAGKTRLHGVAMTQKDAMRDLPWDSVGSTTWLAPGQWGETHIWVGGELKRYPVKSKESSRKRHRTAISDAGFDAEAIARDATEDGTSEDRAELLRMSLWSWGQFVEDINRRRESGEDDEPGRAQRGKPRSAAVVPTTREKVLLPVLSVMHEESGGEGETEAQVGISGLNLMRCDTCFARDKCPKFEPGAECAFEIPMTVTTTTQARALRKAVLAMQGQRVFQMRMFEQLEGGYADPNLSAEIGRLQKMLEADIEADRERASLEIKVTSDGQMGFMNRIFGQDVENRVNALAEPVDANLMLEGAIDAELVEED
jgi:hypothetical protein